MRDDRSMRKHPFIWTSFSAFAISCGGGSTAQLNLFDAPPPGVTAVSIWVKSMQVHVADKDDKKNGDPNDTSIDDDDRWHTLSVNHAIDLVQHEGETAAEVLGQLPLPEGKVTQIRLFVDTAAANTAVLNGMTCNLDTSGVSPTGIKIIHPFKAFASKSGSRHEIFVDFRLDESLVGSGTCFRLLPVIRLTHVRTDGVDVDIALDGKTSTP
jgi:hypothetical protein